MSNWNSFGYIFIYGIYLNICLGLQFFQLMIQCQKTLGEGNGKIVSKTFSGNFLNHLLF